MIPYKNNILLFGGSGFLGNNFSNLLKKQNNNHSIISSKDINLIDTESKSKLTDLNNCENCILIFFSALTPDKGKNIDTYNNNIKMAENFLSVFNDEFKNNNHIIYISSDAVYPLTIENIEFDTYPSPTDLYSSMHLTREIMFKNVFKRNLTILRPTLIYGYGDTHNSYGPNRFFRQMLDKNEINIFGEGSDVRDHLYINDLCRIIYEIIKNKIYGTLNLATGNSISYSDLALIYKNMFKEIKINKIPVNNQKTVRYFNVKSFLDSINYSVNSLEDNLAEYSKLLGIK
ncbi:MAG: hypothetical protein CBE33_05640 [Candidatus Pelagibacter sp. TMED273]|nr:MAG: hypothetical protein CBE33_05640 [Candidatus Pelagibacter sp. TMED273]|tara:strand:- start:7441 stop:8304 length:864 start_codon:yes stop_codon:yes gene_type:complete